MRKCCLAFLPFLFSALPVLGQLDAPSTVSASDGAYSTKVGISWDAVPNAIVYRIFRNTAETPTSAIDLGTTQAGFFFDAGSEAGQIYYYWVKSENDNAESPLSEPDQGSRAQGNPLVGSIPALEPPPVPAGNPMTATKAFLGKTLFWDEQMSSTWTVACGSCHRPEAGGSDPRTLLEPAHATHPGLDRLFGTSDDVGGTIGKPLSQANGDYVWDSLFGFQQQVTRRMGKSVIDAAYGVDLLWDGRASERFRDPITGATVLRRGGGLESQALMPLMDTAEMGHIGRSWDDVTAALVRVEPLGLSPEIPLSLERWIGDRSYPELFEEAFGTPEVTPSRIALAIATYQRTLYSDRTNFDQVNGGIRIHPPSEQRGRELFFTRFNCDLCHTGPQLSDNRYRYIGVRPVEEDLGRFEVDGNESRRGSFRIPSLRNVGLRAPYMHNGQFETLEDVIDFYDRGGDFEAPNKSGLIRPLNMTAQQKVDLVAFLRNELTDPRVVAEEPPFDRPRLYSESNRIPEIFDTGIAGAGGFLPQIVAVEPPVVGNPNFTIGLSQGLGRAWSVLAVDTVDPSPWAQFRRVYLNLPSLEGEGAGAGHTSISFPIPEDPSLIGRELFIRWFVMDPAADRGWATSPGLRMTFFGSQDTR